MVITDCEDIGTVDGNHIFQVKDVDTIAILDQAFGNFQELVKFNNFRKINYSTTKRGF